MKLEDQVCSLELAKRLKELGVKQDAFFEWAHHICGRAMVWELFLTDPHDTVNEKCSAFTVAELGEILPRGFYSGRPFGKDMYECCPSFYAMPDDRLNAEQSKFLKVPEYQESNEADARAKMLIYLIENKLIKI